MAKDRERPKFVLCLSNEGCDDLQPRKVYRVLPDAAASRRGYLRVIDDSGEDYLYPKSYFVPINVPVAAAEALAMTG